MKESQQMDQFLKKGAWAILSTILLSLFTFAFSEIDQHSKDIEKLKIESIHINQKEDRIYNELKDINKKIDNIIQRDIN